MEDALDGRLARLHLGDVDGHGVHGDAHEDGPVAGRVDPLQTFRLGSARSKPVNALVSTIFAQTSQEAVATQYKHVIDALRDPFPSESPRC